MSLTFLDGPTIQTGESLSDALDCSSGAIMRITMPGYWTPANITFQISTDGDQFNDLVNIDGDEITMACIPRSAVVIAPISEYLRACPFIKIRSGTSKHPVKQEDVRQFAVTIDTAGEAPPASDGAARSNSPRPGNPR